MQSLFEPIDFATAGEINCLHVKSVHKTCQKISCECCADEHNYLGHNGECVYWNTMNADTEAESPHSKSFFLFSTRIYFGLGLSYVHKKFTAKRPILPWFFAWAVTFRRFKKKFQFFQEVQN